MHGKYYVDSQRIIFIRYEMPTVLRMRVFLACKLSFRLLCQNRCTVRREQMPHKACKGHWEFRYNYNFIWQPAQIHIHVQLHLAGTSLYQRCQIKNKFQILLTAPISIPALADYTNVYLNSKLQIIIKSIAMRNYKKILRTQM